MTSVGFRLAAFAALVEPGLALDNGLGLTPPMGYNTWNDLECPNMNEDNVKAVADAMVNNGLLSAGYEYLNLDDCWMDSSRDADGRLQGDLQTFPSGMKALGEYIHSKGLKFGIYGDRGSGTCQGLPGNLGNEQLDAQTYADWAVDYLKEDNCHSSTGANDQDQLFAEFALMRDALNATGRNIFFSVCGGGDQFFTGFQDISYYAKDPRGAGQLANAWRITSDVTNWETSRFAEVTANALSQYAGRGGFNDPDMLLGSSGSAKRKLSQKHSRTQFNVWAMLAAPLMIGADVRELDEFDIETYTNEEVIGLNQDILAQQGKRVMHSLVVPFDKAIWAKELKSGDVALMFENNMPLTSRVTCDADCWSQLPFAPGTKLHVRDVWAHGPAENAMAYAGEPYTVSLAGNGESALYKLSLSSESDVMV